MHKLERLERYVDEGSVRLIQEIAVPRSISTAIGRALCLSHDPSAYIDASRLEWSLERTAAVVCDTVRAELPADGRQLTAVVRFMAPGLDDASFSYISGLAEATLWTVRDPRRQVRSMLSQLAAHSIHSVYSEALPDDGWEAMARHFAAYGRQSSEILLADSDALTHDPSGVLRTVCHGLGIRYCAVMASGISHETVESRLPPMDITGLPEHLRCHLENVALPTYQAMGEAAARAALSKSYDSGLASRR